MNHYAYMNQKQKLLLATIGTVLFIITFNQYIDATRFKKVYVSSYTPEVKASEPEDMAQVDGEVARSTGGEDSQQTLNSLKVESSPDNSPESSPEQLIKEAFGKDAPIAIAIAKAESHLNPEAVGDLHITFEKDGKLMGMSCGLFQVRILEGRPDCETLKNPKVNIEYAKKLYKAKGDFTDWSAYNSGVYLKYL